MLVHMNATRDTIVCVLMNQSGGCAIPQNCMHFDSVEIRRAAEVCYVIGKLDLI